MLKNSTLVLFIMLCAFTLPAVAQNRTSPTHSEGGSKFVKLYPNPATTKINFEIQTQNDKAYEIIVYNFLGKKMDHLKSIVARTELQLDNYYSGVYIYQLRDRSGAVLESGKFNVVK
ncbi:putative secreted protein (Por secretion system target) [Chitinophaga skermanii]|uniref:Putative secreted protein (Por secretion system target) n=1 Tax=Chitinophaga skermanii TaxID=331697 RepID=A0A327Q870_9BACT|nr:T9SS type A sorting domain-containing protein [Chitinophaga skermanii]RAI99901.1 putative secreted protein (Por secretion system target) [Chitinophaga skermanii]